MKTRQRCTALPAYPTLLLAILIALVLIIDCHVESARIGRQRTNSRRPLPTTNARIPSRRLGSDIYSDNDTGVSGSDSGTDVGDGGGDAGSSNDTSGDGEGFNETDSNDTGGSSDTDSGGDINGGDWAGNNDTDSGGDINGGDWAGNNDTDSGGDINGGDWAGNNDTDSGGDINGGDWAGNNDTDSGGDINGGDWTGTNNTDSGEDSSGGEWTGNNNTDSGGDINGGDCTGSNNTDSGGDINGGVSTGTNNTDSGGDMNGGVWTGTNNTDSGGDSNGGVWTGTNNTDSGGDINGGDWAGNNNTDSGGDCTNGGNGCDGSGTNNTSGNNTDSGGGFNQDGGTGGSGDGGAGASGDGGYPGGGDVSPPGPPMAGTTTAATDTSAACWAFAAAAAVEAAVAIFTATTPARLSLSAQQLLDCAPGTCMGGYPEDALQYSSTSLLRRASQYPYVMDKGACRGGLQRAAAMVSHFEQVALEGSLGLMLAVRQQPVVVSILASSPDFVAYKSGIYSNATCFSPSNPVLDHVVLVIGFRFESTASIGNYFIIRNSWGSKWGESGHMRIAMTPAYGGMCGMTYQRGLYPTIKASLIQDPCKLAVCGGGTCTRTGVGRYTCDCPSAKGLLKGENKDGTETCIIKSKCSLFATNPCGVGVCVDGSSGEISCVCPPDSTSSQLACGQPTCVP
ncbi:unnamed protein product, partial [Closterium sp. NIES-54]